MQPIELTKFEKPQADGPLSKTISLDPQTSLPVSDSSECRLVMGVAARLLLSSVSDLAVVLSNCTSQHAWALGCIIPSVKPGKGSKVIPVTTVARLSKAAKGTITRSKEFLEFRPGVPAYMLLDLDFKGM